MSAAPKAKQLPHRDARIIDAAYGLVLGAFDDLCGSQDVGFAEWNKPEVQAAAMAAAEAFFKQMKL